MVRTATVGFHPLEQLFLPGECPKDEDNMICLYDWKGMLRLTTAHLTTIPWEDGSVYPPRTAHSRIFVAFVMPTSQYALAVPLAIHHRPSHTQPYSGNLIARHTRPPPVVTPHRPSTSVGGPVVPSSDGSRCVLRRYSGPPAPGVVDPQHTHTHTHSPHLYRSLRRKWGIRKNHLAVFGVYTQAARRRSGRV